MSTKKKVPVKKATSHPEPNPTLAAATEKLEVTIKTMENTIQDASSVEERQVIINILKQVLTELKS